MTDSEPFPAIAERGNRPRLGDAARIPLAGAYVDPRTAALLLEWMDSGLSRGLVIDQIAEFAAARGFAPAAPKKKGA